MRASNNKNGILLTGSTAALVVVVAIATLIQTQEVDAVPSARFLRSRAAYSLRPSLPAPVTPLGWFPRASRRSPPSTFSSMEDLLSSELVDRSRQREAIEAWRALRPERYEPFSSKWNALLMYFLLDMRSRGMNVERLVDAEVRQLISNGSNNDEDEDEETTSDHGREEEDDEQARPAPGADKRRDMRIRRDGNQPLGSQLPANVRDNLARLLREATDGSGHSSQQRSVSINPGAPGGPGGIPDVDQSDLVYRKDDHGEPVICDNKPFKRCFRIDSRGSFVPAVIRPSRLLRVY